MTKIHPQPLTVARTSEHGNENGKSRKIRPAQKIGMPTKQAMLDRSTALGDS